MRMFEREIHTGRAVAARTRGAAMIAAFGVLGALGACNGNQQQQAPPDTMHGAPMVSSRSAKTDSICAALGWEATCPVWEVSDDQALNDGGGRYGPLVHIIPSPELRTLATVGRFDSKGPNGALVALVVVDSPFVMRKTASGTSEVATLPGTYTALNLQPGHNCLYVAHSGGDESAGWQAFMTRAADGSDPCPAAHPTSNALEVEAWQHPLLKESEDYPAVARIHEGTRGEQRWVPQFGLKCANRWCFVKGTSSVVPLPQATVIPAGLDVARARAVRTWLVPGWGDVQHLGDRPASSGSGPTPKFGVTGFQAAFVADPRLEHATFSTFRSGPWIHVGTIWMPAAPPAGSKYASRWRMKQGRNEMYFKLKGDNDWSGILVVGTDTVRLNVEREDHPGLFVPGVVRFRWDFADEAGWVRCDVGCCEVAPQ